MKKGMLYITGVVAFAVLLTLNILTIQSSTNLTLGGEKAHAQTADVQCVDVEDYGSGPNRDRICADGTTALCEWNDWSGQDATLGTCTLEGESDPQLN